MKAIINSYWWIDNLKTTDRCQTGTFGSDLTLDPTATFLVAMPSASPGGSVAPSCCAAAKRTATSGAEEEERSDEPQTAAVAPGEALRKDFQRLAARWINQSAARGKENGKLVTNPAYLAGLADGNAAAMFYCSQMILAILAEPDSDAPLGASGRRNAGGMARELAAQKPESPTDING